ncbi:RraA family protein [Salmonella enterica subsp. enterica serovar Minnesota]|nr:RraA family protein [Salmonella enterica subsp. enterica serovar Minnesota]ECI4647153.1 RraA family protein [Salmonella enterica subsp. salamae]
MTSKIIAPRQNIGTQLVESWRDVSASTLGHLTCEGYLEGLRPLSENVHLLGNVVTVKVFLPDGGILRDALLLSQPGDVLVIECVGDRKYACWGELRTLAARIKGLAGVIVGGTVTDVAVLREECFPVFSEGISAVTTHPVEGARGSVNQPVRVAGIDILPGTLAIGDDDGVFILTPRQVRDLLSYAKEKQIRDTKRKLEMVVQLRPHH